MMPSAFSSTWPKIRTALEHLDCGDHSILIAAQATIQVECPSWLPVREKHADPKRQPDLWKLQERYWPSGYYGRGLLQHTWRRNYERLEKALSLPLLAQPDLLLEVNVAARAFAWQFQADGAAKAALAEDWRKVRRIINGPGMLHLDRFLEAIETLKTYTTKGDSPCMI